MRTIKMTEVPSESRIRIRIRFYRTSHQTKLLEFEGKRKLSSISICWDAFNPQLILLFPTFLPHSFYHFFPLSMYLSRHILASLVQTKKERLWGRRRAILLFFSFCPRNWCLIHSLGENVWCDSNGVKREREETKNGAKVMHQKYKCSLMYANSSFLYQFKDGCVTDRYLIVVK